jgi:hypothetical protein
VDGLPVADTIADLVNSNKIYYPIRVDAAGVERTLDDFAGESVLTGTLPDGTFGGTSCGDWVSSQAQVLAGSALSGPVRWTQASQTNCGFPRSHYCFGTSRNQVLAAPTASGRRAFVLTSGWSIFLNPGRDQADLACQNEASLRGFANAASFKALLGTTSEPPAARFDGTGATWVRPDGVRLAETAADFFGQYVHTNAMTGSGTTAAEVGDADCGGWSASSGQANRGVTSTMRYQFRESTGSCSGAIYCLED